MGTIGPKTKNDPKQQLHQETNDYNFVESMTLETWSFSNQPIKCPEVHNLNMNRGTLEAPMKNPWRHPFGAPPRAWWRRSRANEGRRQWRELTDAIRAVQLRPPLSLSPPLQNPWAPLLVASSDAALVISSPMQPRAPLRGPWRRPNGCPLGPDSGAPVSLREAPKWAPSWATRKVPPQGPLCQFSKILCNLGTQWYILIVSY